MPPRARFERLPAAARTYSSFYMPLIIRVTRIIGYNRQPFEGANNPVNWNQLRDEDAEQSFSPIDFDRLVTDYERAYAQSRSGRAILHSFQSLIRAGGGYIDALHQEAFLLGVEDVRYVSSVSDEQLARFHALSQRAVHYGEILERHGLIARHDPPRVARRDPPLTRVDEMRAPLRTDAGVVFERTSHGQRRMYYGRVVREPRGVRFRNDQGAVEEWDVPADAPLHPARFRDDPLPAARDENVLTRRDRDARVGTVDAQALRVAYDARAARDARAWRFNMVTNTNVASSQVDASTTQGLVQVYSKGSIVPVPEFRRDEFQYEVQRWVGLFFSKTYAEGSDVWRYYGQVTGVILRQPQLVTAMPDGYRPAVAHQLAPGDRVMVYVRNLWRPGVVAEGGATAAVQTTSTGRTDVLPLEPANRLSDEEVRNEDAWEQDWVSGTWLALEAGLKPTTAFIGYVVEFRYRSENDGPELYSVDLIPRRAALATTRDEAELPPVAERRVQQGAPRLPPWSAASSVRDPWTALTQAERAVAVAQVFYDPPFYAAVTSVQLNPLQVTLDFGRHYGEIRGGATTRVFAARACAVHRIVILPPAQAAVWQAPTPEEPLMELHNQFLALRFADKSTFVSKRDWFTPLPVHPGGLDGFFQQQYGVRDGPRYAHLWLHKCVLDRLPLAPRGTITSGAHLTARQVVSRTRNALNHIAGVVPLSVVKALANLQPDENEDDDDDEDDTNASMFVGFPDGWYLGWNKMKKDFGRRWDEWRAQRARLAFLNDQDVDFQGEGETMGEMRDRIFQGWQPPNDAFYRVVQSSMLNKAQRGSVYSTIGTRVHLRKALLSCADENDAPNDGWLRMQPRVGRSLYFAPAESAQRNTYRGERGAFEIRLECAQFCWASEDTTAAYVAYGADMRVEDVTLRVFQARLQDEEDFVGSRLVAVELPVVNPFFMFRTAANNRRFMIQQTQADFLCQLQRRDGAGRGPIVLGEYKCLMETNKPLYRVDNKDNYHQVVANALMFEAMTNIRVDYGMVILFTRRNRAYVITFPIRGEGEFDNFIFRKTLIAPFGEAVEALYTDNAHRASFRLTSAVTPDVVPAAELFDMERGEGVAMQHSWGENPVAPPAQSYAPPSYPDFRRLNLAVLGGAQPDEAYILTKRARQPLANVPDDSESDDEGGGGGEGGDEGGGEGAGNEDGGSDGEGSGVDEGGGDGGGGEVSDGEPDAPPAPRRNPRRAGRDRRRDAPFYGAGPTDFRTRVRTTADQGQGALYEAVREEASDMAERMWQGQGIGQRRIDAILGDVNGFFLFLREFRFQGRGVQPPDDWDDAAVEEEDGRFGPLHVGRGVPLNRMDAEYLNPPKDDHGEPHYPTHRTDPDTGAWRVLTEDEKKSQIEAILCRTLNRLINDRVQRVYILPHADRLRRNDPLHPDNPTVTVRQAAEQFLHVSQRAFWTPVALQWALATALPQERDTLWAKVRAFA